MSSLVPMLDVMFKGTSYRPCPGSLRTLAPREAYTVPGREVILHTTTLRGKLCLCAHMRGVPRRNVWVWVQAYLCPCTMAASLADEATVSPVETDRAPRRDVHHT